MRVLRSAVAKAVPDSNFKSRSREGKKRGHPTFGEYDEVVIVQRKLAPVR